MHILLINANPVVSRLLLLCTRDDTILLDEITVVKDVENHEYDIVFVDEASYSRDIADLLIKFGRAKKVFISYRSDIMRGFDITIKKPFLPSQITNIIQEVEVPHSDPVTEEKTLLIEDDIEVDETIPHIFPLSSEDEMVDTVEVVEEISAPIVLDSDEIDKIKALLDMDDEDILDETLNDEEIEARKVALIKEQLIADGLEIVEEDEIVEELSINLDGTLTEFSEAKAKETKAKKSMKKKKSKSKKIKFTEENMERIEDAVEMAMATMTKKQMKKLLKGKKIEMSIKLEDNN